MAGIDPRDEAVAVVAVAIAVIPPAVGGTVAEIRATFVVATDTFAARMSVRVNRRIGTVVEVAGALVAGAFVVGTMAAVELRPGGGLNTNVGVDLLIGGGRNTSVGVVVTVAGSE
jgi:hypothetical protein